ncbi:MAG: ABC transporter permease subunit [Hormoscilla sp. GM102CHS1]|nr:ABC transporter permease subunit [Hormoscilla sp. GM102CHS1]
MTRNKDDKIPLWRDDRFWRIALQVIAVLVFILVAGVLLSNLNRNMQQLGIKFGFGFLGNAASFDISESLIAYSSSDSYSRVLLAGLVNSLRVILLAIALTTGLGIAAGIASFSENWLLRKLSRVYVEVVRNTPLLLQLFFWYFAVFFSLPQLSEKIVWPGPIFLSKRGIYIPWPGNSIAAWMWLLVLVVGAIGAVLLWRLRTKIMVEQAASGQQELIVLTAMGMAGIIIIIFGLGWQRPEVTETGAIAGGLRLTIEYAAVLAGLIVHTGAFIAEIVRGGIQSVPKGQWEAAISLGLKSGLGMRLVVFPQALRVIVPSLNSQYINLAKNTSLALAIGYPDLYSVVNTTFNQTGRPIEVILLFMITYLILDLIISFSMNLLNKAVQLKER